MAPVTGAILAGGAGKRMGGVAKGLVPWAGKAMIDHVIERLAPQVDALLVSANRHLDAYARRGFPVYSDLRVETVGPLGGVERMLIECPSPWLVVVPCDAPALPLDLVARLHAAAQGEGALVSYACDAEREHYMHCLIAKSLRPALSGWLDGGGRKVRDWIQSVSHVPVPFADAQAFRNFNTFADLDETS